MSPVLIGISLNPNIKRIVSRDDFCLRSLTPRAYQFLPFICEESLTELSAACQKTIANSENPYKSLSTNDREESRNNLHNQKLLQNAARSFLFSSQQDSLITAGASTESILINFYMPLKKYTSRDSVPLRSLFLIKFTKFILPTICQSVKRLKHMKKFSLIIQLFLIPLDKKVMCRWFRFAQLAKGKKSRPQ